MNRSTDSESEPPEAGRWRLRFGLKSFLLFVTLLCFYLGYRSAREHRVEQMLARRNSVLDAICSNCASPPAGSFYPVNPGSRDSIERYLGRSYPGDAFQRDVILRAGGTGTVSQQSLPIDVSQLLASASLADVAKQLDAHYSQGLDRLGFTRRGGDSEFGEDMADIIAVWTYEANELTVIVQSRVDSHSPTARIRIQFIDSQQLHLW